jgi:hypothetical protein
LVRKWSEFVLNLLIGFLYAAVAGWLIFFPLAGVLTLTVVLAATFIAQGAIEIVMGFRMRGSGGWFALLLADAVAMTLGVMILSGMPSTAPWPSAFQHTVGLAVDRSPPSPKAAAECWIPAFAGMTGWMTGSEMHGRVHPSGTEAQWSSAATGPKHHCEKWPS